MPPDPAPTLQAPGRPKQSRLQAGTGWLSIAAAAVHGGLAPQHFQEWWGYGLFFVAAALAQVVFGLALLTDAVNERDSGPGWRRLRAGMLMAGIVGNLAVLALYVVTRTVGIPWFGPGAGEVEAVAPIDLVANLAEVAVVVLLAVLLRRDARAPQSSSS